MARKVFSIATYSIKEWFSNPRVISLFLLMIILVWSDVSPINIFCRTVDMKVNPLVFPFLIGNQLTQLLYIAGIICLFADAPFINKNQPYILIRSKRTSWMVGQITYIFIATAIYFLVIMLVPLVTLLPNYTFATDGWGKVINTLSQTNAGAEIGLKFPVLDKIITFYTPWQAFGMCFLLEWAVGSFLGLLIFCINLNFHRAFGLITAGVVLFFDLLVVNTLPPKFFYFSPVSLSRINLLDTKGTSAYPSITYTLFFFGISIAIICAILIITVKNKPIEITSEV